MYLIIAHAYNLLILLNSIQSCAISASSENVPSVTLMAMEKIGLQTADHVDCFARRLLYIV